jgi:anti-sigma factor RsiW
MSCKHFEELLPAYAENGLSADDKVRVDTHLRACDSCRESLAFFVRLEATLAERRELRPSDAVAAGRIVHRVGFEKQRSFVAALTGLPAAISGALIAVGIVLFLARGAVQDFLTRLGAIRFSGDFAAGLSEIPSTGLGAVAVGSEWMWAVAYLGVVALILSSGSWMVLRYVRD